jgi:hypothetical protein
MWKETLIVLAVILLLVILIALLGGCVNCRNAVSSVMPMLPLPTPAVATSYAAQPEVINNNSPEPYMSASSILAEIEPFEDDEMRLKKTA